MNKLALGVLTYLVVGLVLGYLTTWIITFLNYLIVDEIGRWGYAIIFTIVVSLLSLIRSDK